MNPWKCKKYRKIYDDSVRTGIYLRFEKGIDPRLRALFLDFARWLRIKYEFPLRVNVYIQNREKVRLLSGAMAFGSFRWFGAMDEPYIRIPAAYDVESTPERSVQETHESILSSFVHELTHYFQWVNQLEQTDRSSEWQANYYRYRIIEQYYQDRKQKWRECPCE